VYGIERSEDGGVRRIALANGVPAAAVPEPATAILLGVGLVAGALTLRGNGRASTGTLHLSSVMYRC